MRIAVKHVTRLEFPDEVSETVMDTHLGPRDDADQRVARFSVRLEPAGHVRRYEDGFGNTAHLLTNMRPHSFLQVSAESEVHTYMADPFQPAAHPPRPLDPIQLADCLDPSPLVPRLAMVDDMASPFRSNSNDDAFDAMRGMTELIYRQFKYEPGVTDVTTSIEQIVAGRQGVCQDFAHLLLGLCRSIDIPARYASGYIVERAHSRANAPSRGVGASHAWVEAFTPTHGWRGFDPTNNLVANEYYVKIAIGRDYSDVPPTRGTYHGGPTESMAVAVTTRALD
ncbi:MAG: transglutaminase family protein [Chloroflexota bacterium]|nr:transglutaminase family protein [Chloroflexota bacterium]